MRKLISFFFILLTLSLSAKERKTVGLVLGGGGAKGAAHIGVLKVLEEAEIPIDYIAGTSIGAIVGGLYSIGYNAHDLDSLIQVLDWKVLLSNTTPESRKSLRARDIDGRYVISIPFKSNKKLDIPAGIINGQNILNLFSGLTVGYHNVSTFDSLPLPFKCVATNLAEENSVVLDQGSLPLNMRSSMSIPGVFVPVQQDSMILVDGGVLNNFPTDVVKSFKPDILIGIDLSTGKTPYKDLMSIGGLINTLTDMTGKAMYMENLKGLDLYLNPDLKGYTAMDFNGASMDTMYNRGLAAARSHWDDILKLKKEIYGDTTDITYETVPESAHIRKGEKLYIKDISISGVSQNTENFLRRKINLKENTYISLDDIDEAIAMFDGMAIFSTCTYKLDGKLNGPYDLIFNLKEQPLNHLNLGLRFDTEEMASLILNTTLYQNFLSGWRLSGTGKLSTNPYLNIKGEWRPNYKSSLGASYNIGYHDFLLYSGRHKRDDISFLWQSADIKYGMCLEAFLFNVGIRWEHFNKSSNLYNTDNNPVPINSESFFNYFAEIGINSYDNEYFPKKGTKGIAKAEIYTDNFYQYQDNGPQIALSLNYELPIELTKRFYAIPGVMGRVLIGDDIPAIYQNYVGGEMNGRYLPQQIAFPGVRGVQVFNNSLLMAKLDLRYEFMKNQYVFAYGYYGHDAKDLSSFDNGRNTWSLGLKYSYDSPIGPLSAQFSYSNHVKRVGFYVNLGYYF